MPGAADTDHNTLNLSTKRRRLSDQAETAPPSTAKPDNDKQQHQQGTTATAEPAERQRKRANSGCSGGGARLASLRPNMKENIENLKSLDPEQRGDTEVHLLSLFYECIFILCWGSGDRLNDFCTMNYHRL